MINNQHLIMFTRYPVPGTTKTRLISRLGAEGAADIQRKMTTHIFSQALKAATPGDIDLEVWYSGGDENSFRSWLGSSARYRRQTEGDIGRRMQDAINCAFARGAQRVVLIGSDVPAISAKLLRRAFSSLAGNDSVLGPALDGGYYLVGLQRRRGHDLAASIFSGIQWSTATVFAETLDVLHQHDASVAVLEKLQDIDRPEDLDEAGKWLDL